METVVTCFTDNLEDNENGTGQANGQTRYVDHIECFVPVDTPDRNPKKILPHMY